MQMQMTRYCISIVRLMLKSCDICNAEQHETLLQLRNLISKRGIFLLCLHFVQNTPYRNVCET